MGGAAVIFFGKKGAGKTTLLNQLCKELDSMPKGRIPFLRGTEWDYQIQEYELTKGETKLLLLEAGGLLDFELPPEKVLLSGVKYGNKIAARYPIPFLLIRWAEEAKNVAAMLTFLGQLFQQIPHARLNIVITHCQTEQEASESCWHEELEELCTAQNINLGKVIPFKGSVSSYGDDDVLKAVDEIIQQEQKRLAAEQSKSQPQPHHPVVTQP